MPNSYKVLNWNVNSINARLERVVKALERHQPDVVCFQETKTVDEKFPYEALQALGYHCYVHGQKSYNGVCILSKEEAVEITKGFGDGANDDHARFIFTKFKRFSVASAYIPNGQELGAPAYTFKLEWLERLKRFILNRELVGQPFVVTGDFNIAFEDIDVYDPKVWKGRIHFSEPEKEKIRELKAMGLTDVFRHFYPDTQAFSWWDYRNLSFPKNLGLRIDYFFASQLALKACKEVLMDREERKGEKPSDHIPLVAEFSF